MLAEPMDIERIEPMQFRSIEVASESPVAADISLRGDAQAAARNNVAAAPSSADLKPKEHGAYAILTIPSITALLSHGFSVAGVYVALAAGVGFFAHEPLMVMLGKRGARAQRLASEANRRCLVLLATAIVLGLIALGLAAQPARWGLLICLALAVISFAVSMRGWHRTLAGQLLGAAALSAPCFPIMLCVATSGPEALAIWSVWLIGFGATTTAVRSVIAAQKRQARLAHLLVLLSLSAIVAGLPLQYGYWPLLTMPMLMASWWLYVNPPPVKHIRRIGWTLVAVTMITSVVMVLAKYAEAELWS